MAIEPNNAGTAKATLNRITANNNMYGVTTAGRHPLTKLGHDTTIANSVLSNNTTAGLEADNPGTVRLAKTVISGNTTGVEVGGTPGVQLRG